MSEDLDEKENDFIKIVLIGEMYTGKTSLINVYFGLEFSNDLPSTLSPSVSQKELKFHGVPYIIHMWDTAGQEKYRSMTKIFIKGAQIVIFVYDITNESTFEKLGFWVKSVEDILGKDPILAVIGNKIDLFEKQEVFKVKGEAYAKEIGALFYESSAKDDPKGFQNFISVLIEELLEKKGVVKRKGDQLSTRTLKKPKGCSC
jgi:small GTP-binding protein